jgi:hypothetical protein
LPTEAGASGAAPLRGQNPLTMQDHCTDPEGWFSYLIKLEMNPIPPAPLPGEKGSAMIATDKTDRPTPGSPAFDDGGAHHRSEHRKRTLKEAKIILTDWTVMDCTIRDISEKGARLVLGDAVTLPAEFRLHIVSSNTIVPVQVLWQRGTTAGVGFTGPEEPAPSRKI